jgi:hypothetical protein
LHGLPVSNVLNCALELWRDLELDDDELLEIAIRDVSYQIQLEKEREEGFDPPIAIDAVESHSSWGDGISSDTSFGSNTSKLRMSKSFDSGHRRFNPRVDATVLYLEIKNLKLNLLHFQFRIEKQEKKTVFDPVFEGRGAVSLENVNIRLRIDCAKHKQYDTISNSDVLLPILRLRELDVVLEKFRMKVKDTGFGSDWILNKAVDVFEENITKVVEVRFKRVSSFHTHSVTSLFLPRFSAGKSKRANQCTSRNSFGQFKLLFRCQPKHSSESVRHFD